MLLIWLLHSSTVKCHRFMSKTVVLCFIKRFIMTANLFQATGAGHSCVQYACSPHVWFPLGALIFSDSQKHAANERAQIYMRVVSGKASGTKTIMLIIFITILIIII